MFKVLIADDEHIARKIIKLLLNDQPDMTEVYEAKDGTQTLELATKYQPDIIFLDIQMPGKSGIQLAENLPSDCVVIFVTAYDKYAVEAFELCAIDYLLKPFPDQRFYTALEKARRHIQEQKHSNHSQASELLKHLDEEKGLEYRSRLIVKEPGRIRIIEVQHINFISGAGNYAEVHLFNGTCILHRETLTKLEAQLDPNQFIRIHRSSLVRKTSICELKPNDNGDYSVVLKSGDALTLSRRNRSKLAELLV
ncbi:LytTR family DNA-binding domain-containing protein [uncultured Paraglaciecola sp.]|uniref:LytR/AlgR family response regulator transcription factor n=1 Tax=uncultured Paraglaciecola sp. TaxID=1765024 RepID=UPI00262A4D8F|nr:LytTR family DNA-binding domain-containing protein [uncultured Paraglaciecola sp.]